MPDDDEGWDVPTPPEKKTSGSWLSFRDIAIELRARLDNAAQAKSSPNLVLRDLEGAQWCIQWGERLGELASSFERWPSCPEQAAEERVPLTTELFELVRKGGELLSRMPGGPW